MITQDFAESELLNTTEGREFQHFTWTKNKFKIFKLMSTTEKGDIGEDFLSIMLKACGYEKVVVVKGRRGSYDVSVERGYKKILFESKVATLDTNSSFQFNGIRYDTEYTHLFCLGISPDKIGYIIVKKQLLGNDPHRMVSMAKGSNSAFKLTKKEGELNNFNDFCESVNILWE